MPKNFLIIGASSGIGFALAERLLQDGHHVISASRQKPALDGVEHITWEAPHEFPKEVLPASLDGVVYCPGTISLKPFHRFTSADFSKDFEINVLGAVQVLQSALSSLKASGAGSVVLFSTVAVQTGMSFHASIAAAKGAVEGLTRSLAAEWAPHKIRVNAIAPSLTQTPLVVALLNSPEKVDASNKRHPLGRVGQPADSAQLANFLLNEESQWLTGQIIGLDGGLGSLK
jgi:3-oxoacyl-[acyl-carrier protein] reductase